MKLYAICAHGPGRPGKGEGGDVRGKGMENMGKCFTGLKGDGRLLLH